MARQLPSPPAACCPASSGSPLRHGLLATNPVRDIPARRTARSPRRPRALSAEDADLLRARLATDAAAVGRDLPDLVEFLLGTGLRIGEACALRPTDLDLDLDLGTVTVTGTVIRQPGHGLLIQDVPKTGAGRRTIPLPLRTVELLRRRLAALSPQAGDPVVFPSPNGHLRDPSNTSAHLRQALDRAGLPWVTYTFRKTVATRLDDAGLSARQIADHLGHSRPSLTQDVYLARGTATPRTAAAIRRAL